MITNIDVAIIINREIDDTSDVEKQYLGFKLEKFRGKPNDDRIYVFLHPFDEENSISLIPDIDTKPLSRTRMEDFEPMKHPEVSSQHVSFEPMTDFRSSFIDIIDDNYKDTSKHYINIMNKAEEVTAKMRKIQEKEREIKRQREKELKNSFQKRVIIQSRKDNYNRDDHGRIIISKREPVYYDNKGRLIIHRNK